LESSGIQVDGLRRIPVTRDVRLFAIFIGAIAGLPQAALYYIALAPFAYYAAAIILAKGLTAVEIQKPVKRSKRPWPDIQAQANLVKQSISELVGRVLRLILALLVVKIVSPIFSGFTLISLEDAALTSDNVMLVVEMGLVIYFGYKILISVKKLSDAIATRLVSRLGATRETLKRIFLDILYASLGLIAWIYAAKLSGIPLIGDILSKVMMTAAAAFLLITLYRLGRRIYGVFADAYDRLIERLARRLSHAPEE